jgi:hypothetical protein
MSMTRLLARIAGVCALNNFGEAPYPTMAGEHIYDSKIEPIEDSKEDIVYPMCAIYTDYDKDHWNYSGGTMKHRLMTVTIELIVVQFQLQKPPKGAPASAPPVYEARYPLTDSELETSLDIFETQVFRALAAGNVASDLFSYLCPSYESAVSRRGASWEGGQRLAARQITLETKAVRDLASGKIPPQVEAFLTRLESFQDYADRVDDIREMMTAPADLSDNARLMQSIGWSSQVASILGHSISPSGSLPSAISILDNNGVEQ